MRPPELSVICDPKTWDRWNDDPIGWVGYMKVRAELERIAYHGAEPTVYLPQSTLREHGVSRTGAQVFDMPVYLDRNAPRGTCYVRWVEGLPEESPDTSWVEWLESL